MSRSDNKNQTCAVICVIHQVRHQILTLTHTRGKSHQTDMCLVCVREWHAADCRWDKSLSFNFTKHTPEIRYKWGQTGFTCQQLDVCQHETYSEIQNTTQHNTQSIKEECTHYKTHKAITAYWSYTNLGIGRYTVLLWIIHTAHTLYLNTDAQKLFNVIVCPLIT